MENSPKQSNYKFEMSSERHVSDVTNHQENSVLKLCAVNFKIYCKYEIDKQVRLVIQSVALDILNNCYY